MSRLKKYRGSLLRLVPVVGLVAFMSIQPASVSQGMSAGRDFARCIVGCNQAKRDCRAACKDTCDSLYSNGRDRRMCVKSCNGDCQEIRNECRRDCRGIKPPPTPTVP